MSASTCGMPSHNGAATAGGHFSGMCGVLSSGDIGCSSSSSEANPAASEAECKQPWVVAATAGARSTADRAYCTLLLAVYLMSLSRSNHFM